jgi:hypothetical protein
VLFFSKVVYGYFFPIFGSVNKTGGSVSKKSIKSLIGVLVVFLALFASRPCPAEDNDLIHLPTKSSTFVGKKYAKSSLSKSCKIASFKEVVKRTHDDLEPEEWERNRTPDGNYPGL